MFGVRHVKLDPRTGHRLRDRVEQRHPSLGAGARRRRRIVQAGLRDRGAGPVPGSRDVRPDGRRPGRTRMHVYNGTETLDDQSLYRSGQCGPRRRPALVTRERRWGLVVTPPAWIKLADLQHALEKVPGILKSKDPTPLSKRNESMIEYYRRLTFANAHFSNTYSEGWKTDMGMVYILFGMPTNIERHPYEMDTKPYEIWQYDNINRQFVFVDYSGFGD